MRLETIKNRSDFLSAAQRGTKFVTGTFILQRCKRSASHPAGQTATRFGLTVTKKMGNAVARNRIKRRLREALKKTQVKYLQSGNDYVMISRNKALDCPFTDLLRDMEFAFSRIISMKDTSTKEP